MENAPQYQFTPTDVRDFLADRLPEDSDPHPMVVAYVVMGQVYFDDLADHFDIDLSALLTKEQRDYMETAFFADMADIPFFIGTFIREAALDLFGQLSHLDQENTKYIIRGTFGSFDVANEDALLEDIARVREAIAS